MNPSDYHTEYLNIYNRTQSGNDDSKMMKVYNMINVAMVVKGIRPGAIIASISEPNKASVVASLQALGCAVKDIRQTRNGHPVLLFVREDNQPKRNLLASMTSILNLPDLPTNQDPTINNQTQRVNMPHETVGSLIGYFNSMSMTNLQTETKSVGIIVNVNVNDIPVSINLFPQKVKYLDSTRKQTLLHMADQIRSLDLPEGFQITSVEPYFTSNGIRRPISPSVTPNPPQRLTGGRNKRRYRTRRRSRSRSSRR